MPLMRKALKLNTVQYNSSEVHSKESVIAKTYICSKNVKVCCNRAACSSMHGNKTLHSKQLKGILCVVNIKQSLKDLHELLKCCDTIFVSFPQLVLTLQTVGFKGLCRKMSNHSNRKPKIGIKEYYLNAVVTVVA